MINNIITENEHTSLAFSWPTSPESIVIALPVSSSPSPLICE